MFMSKIKKIVIAVVIVLSLGAIAKQYNERNHEAMAIKECGNKDNIAKVDSRGFECKD